MDDSKQIDRPKLAGYEQASLETSLPVSTVPASCPWTPAQIIDEDWMPAD